MPQIDSFSVAHRYLSNFHICAVVHQGLLYQTAEHAYQAAKVPRKDRGPFRAPDLTAGQAKRLGQKVACRGDWEEARLWVMREVVLDKFTRNPPIAHRLVGTAGQDLVEGNTWGDTFWGVCGGQGQNHLGRILMEVRSILVDLSVPPLV